MQTIDLIHNKQPGSLRSLRSSTNTKQTIYWRDGSRKWAFIFQSTKLKWPTDTKRCSGSTSQQDKADRIHNETSPHFSYNDYNSEIVNNKYWWGKSTLIHCWWECELVQPLWKTVWIYENRSTIWSSHPTSRNLSKWSKISIWEACLHSHV